MVYFFEENTETGISRPDIFPVAPNIIEVHLELSMFWWGLPALESNTSDPNVINLLRVRFYQSSWDALLR